MGELKKAYWRIREGLRDTPYVHPRNPVLHDPVPEIPLEDFEKPEVQREIDRMFSVAEADKHNGQVGLAHNQIAPDGNPLRMMLLNTTPETPESGGLEFYANPRLTPSAETKKGMDGCFSVDKDIVGEVERAAAGTLYGYDRYGQALDPTILKGLRAQVADHEIDHLNGVTFPNRLEFPEQGLRRSRILGEEDLWVPLTERQLGRVQKGKRAQTVLGRLFSR